jgi:hypothetical protein
MALAQRARYAKLKQVAEPAQDVELCRTPLGWMKNDPEYRKSFEEAREEACGLLEDEAVRRAYQGTLRPQAMGSGKVSMASEFSNQLLMFLLKCRNPKVFGDRQEDTVQIDGQLSIADILRSRRQERLAREATEGAATKAAAIRVDPQPLELESASEEKQECCS